MLSTSNNYKEVISLNLSSAQSSVANLSISSASIHQVLTIEVHIQVP
jgi:hypothetical protein